MRTHQSSPRIVHADGTGGWHLPGGILGALVTVLAALLLVGAASCGGDESPAADRTASNTLEGFIDEALGDGTTGSGEVADGDDRAAEDSVTPSDSNPDNLAALNRLGNEMFRPDIKNPSGFINAEPFTLEDLDGQVILIDFWTYTCINCIRTLPYLKDWHAKYADDGLAIVGVHSPEFAFEKERANVEQAAAEFGLEYRIVQDNDFGTWRNYNNRYWPAKYLIDRDGYIRYAHFGEGAYEETELKIRELLAENGGQVSMDDSEILPTRDYEEAALRIDDPQMSVTRELYAGTERNYSALRFGGQPPYVRHEQYYARQDIALEYADPGVHENHFIYLNGLWRNGPESLTHARTTEAYEDYVAIKFYGTSANIVLGLPESGDFYEVRVTIDGEPIPADHAGEDVMWDDEGNSYLLVNEDRMYRVARTPEYGGYELKLASNSDHFEFFAFTFGVFKNL